MKSSVTTGSKEILRTKLRAADFDAFSLLGQAALRTAEREGDWEIISYQTTSSSVTFGDVLNRLNWFLSAETVTCLNQNNLDIV